MKKRVFTFILLFAFFSQNVSAAVLGNVITQWQHDIATGTQLHNSVYMSEQTGVGKQTEYYAEYTPNADIVPTVINGSSIWGTRTITEAEKYMKDNGMMPMIGINASFFSFKTGIPMGHVISEGRILSKDTMSYPSVGFYPDGISFIGPLSITTTLTAGDIEIDVAHINKYNQSTINMLNLYTDDFGEHNHSDTTSLNVLLENLSGELGIGKTLTATVQEKYVYTGPLIIPDDKILLTLNDFAPAELYNALDSLEAGMEVQISSYANEGRWNYVESGLGSEGEQLILNGEVQSGLGTGAAPRTAVGVTENGNVIFYVIDGRQPGHSFGVQKKTLANRLKELGCVDAINLDGGGSTAISGIYPGSDEHSVLNSPSEGVLRNCTNYIFLQNMQKPTGEINKLYIYPFEQHYLSGYSEQIFPTAVDTAYYSVNPPSEVSYSVDGTESTVDERGILKAKGDGRFSVNVTGAGVSGSASYHVYETPTDIVVYDADTNKEINSFNLKKEDIVKLNLTANSGHINLKSNNSCFDIQVTNDMGYVNENNELVITSDGGKGALKVTAGEYVKEIPIMVEYDSVFSDIQDHWAEDMINDIRSMNIITGYDTEHGSEFRPDNNITRQEFAVVMCRFLDINPEEFSGTELIYDDSSEVSDWAKGSVAAMYEAGIISGKADGKKINFAPTDTVTRAEAMTILGRVIDGEISSEIDFADAADIPEWAAEKINIMVSNGFVNGYDDNTIRPSGKVTRAEAVTMIYKIINTSF